MTHCREISCSSGLVRDASGEITEGQQDFRLHLSSSAKVRLLQSEQMTVPFPDDLTEHVLQFVDTHKDRNAVSLVCKAWNRLEARSRQRVFIGNCYAVSPEKVAERFPRMKSLTLKGKPRFADFDLVPPMWGACVHPWIATLSLSCRLLGELRLKRMTVTDESLELIARALPCFRVLVLTSCDGFSTDGLATIASSCKHLTHLDLTENEIDNKSGSWLNAFPETSTSLVSLNFEYLDSEMDFPALEELVARCTSLKTLKLNRSISLVQLQQLLLRAPQLVELGTGSFAPAITTEEEVNVRNAFSSCSQLQSLSGFWDVAPAHLSIIQPVCSNLVSLNLSYSPVSDLELLDIVSECHKLRRLWLMDSVGDTGLQAVAASCNDLRDFRVYPANKGGQGKGVTEEGLVYISEGCRSLSSILYFCNQMTNAAVERMAQNCPTLISFRLCIMEPARPDHVTHEPMDEGFGAIVKRCKSLHRLAVSGWLTDRAFEYIGAYAKSLERLSVAFAGESDMAMQHVLRGCTSLKKLEIRDSPFGDMALLSGLHRYESMRSLWMSDCNVTFSGCSWLANQKPRLNVEIIHKRGREPLVESVYVYRSVAGHRKDKPPFVFAL